jgi:succinate dehydrogenase/fumarate reductase flavoprotein subunit
MLPLEKNYWRTGEGLSASLARFESLWRDQIPDFGWIAQSDVKSTVRDRVRAREAASLLAAGRLMYTSANAREESRGLHRRRDFPGFNPEFDGQHLISGGLDRIWVRKSAHVNTLSERLALRAA